MESNKNNFQTIKENFCAILDVVNEENTQIKEQIAILAEENKGLKEEIGTLVEKINILVNLVEELKNSSNNFVATISPDNIALEAPTQLEEKEPNVESQVLAAEEEDVVVEEQAEEEEVSSLVEEVEEEIVTEQDMVEQDVAVDEVVAVDEKAEEYEEEDAEYEEQEDKYQEEDKEEADDKEEEEVAEYKEERVAESKEDGEIYREDEDISFELDLQEIESEAPRILHEASKPEWYDWEVDYPAPYVENIQEGIGFNDKMLFIRELFNEDDEVFSQTIEELNKLDKFKAAVEYIRSEFPEWNEEGDVVYRFYMSVRRKLRK